MKTFYKIFVATMVFVLLIYFGVSYIKTNNMENNTEISIQELQQQVSELSENVSSLCYVLESKEEELQVATFSLRQARQEIDSQTITIDTLCDEIVKKNNEISLLSLNNEELLESVAHLEGENALLMEENQLLINELENLQGDIENNSERITAIEERLVDIEKDIILNQGYIADLELAIENQNYEINTLVGIVENMQVEVDACIARVDELTASVNSYDSRITSLEEDIKLVKVNIANINAQIEAINSSIELLESNAMIEYSLEPGFGHCVFKNGIKIAWGVVEVSGTGAVWKELPFAYTGRESYQLFVSVIRTNADKSGVDVVYGYRESNAVIKVTHDYVTNSVSTYASYFVIGY